VPSFPKAAPWRRTAAAFADGIGNRPLGVARRGWDVAPAVRNACASPYTLS
jgi:hypothetical protein